MSKPKTAYSALSKADTAFSQFGFYWLLETGARWLDEKGNCLLLEIDPNNTVYSEL